MDLHKVKMAELNLQKVGDTCNVLLTIWKIPGNSKLLHLCSSKPLCLQHSNSHYFSQNHFLQVSGYPELFLPSSDHTLMPQNGTGENMFMRLCMAFSKEARIYNREKRVSSPGALVSTPKVYKLTLESYAVFGGYSENSSL